jgi:hypothetical protein
MRLPVATVEPGPLLSSLFFLLLAVVLSRPIAIETTTPFPPRALLPSPTRRRPRTSGECHLFFFPPETATCSVLGEPNAPFGRSVRVASPVEKKKEKDKQPAQARARDPQTLRSGDDKKITISDNSYYIH